jgi:L-ascorbate metabolism protein UlaG (beta-lactamase superfamily)
MTISPHLDDEQFRLKSGTKRKTMNYSDPVYLRPNIQVEPLVDQWYAWSHLISPATAARNMTQRHFRIMESYLSAPQIHASAAANPKMLGGPFMDYKEPRVNSVRELLEQTKARRTKLIKLSEALVEINDFLELNAKGQSLKGLYSLVPSELRGYVELVYDLNGRPSLRVLESLLYKSPFYMPDAQTLLLSPISQDDRPFVLSTPRLIEDHQIHLNIPFADALVDKLFALKQRSLPLQEILDTFSIGKEKTKLFESFFTPDLPKPYDRYTGKGLRWRYFGHACILIETAKSSILVDPILSYTYESTISRFTYEDLPDVIDYVLITHNHQDHVLFETLLQIRHKIGAVIIPRGAGGTLQDPSLKLILTAIGFGNVIELDDLEKLTTLEGEITALPFFGEHADLDIKTKAAYLVRLGSHTILFAADSCNIEPQLYRNVQRVVGDVDTLFLGMECDGAPLSWLYGPLLLRRIDRVSDESRRLSGSNCREGMEMVGAFHCKSVFVYAMGQEPWLTHISSIKYTEDSNPIVQSEELIKSCKEQGIEAERLFGEREMQL